MNYYEAKFARQRKERPTDWIIVHTAPGRPFFLMQIARGPAKAKTSN